MFLNYLKITLRTLRKNRVFSLINSTGLALGIAAFVLILEYVAYERSVNGFHQNLPTLFRVLAQNREGDIVSDMAPAVGPLAKQEFPEVNDFCRVGEHSANGIISVANGSNGQAAQSFREDKLAYADASFFTLFTFPIVEGTAASALVQPNTVALSQSQARKYFGDKKPLGQTLTLNNQFGKTLYTVSAVYADMPRNSDLIFDAVFSLVTLANPANLNGNDWARLDSFDGSYLTTFLKLAEEAPGIPANEAALAAKINAYKKKVTPEDETLFLVQPATSMHLAASLSDTYPTSGSLGFVYLLSGIAGLILLIAWFNYVNLSTAGALKRAKEVGIRKVIGAAPGQLIVQFLGESLLLNMAGFGLAMVLVASLQRSFNAFVQKELSLDVLNANGFWLGGLALLVVGAVASGGYVAFTLTSFQPIKTLKGAYQAGKGGWLRKTLVVAQFSASVALVIATMVLYRQLQFMQNKDLGVRLAQRVVVKRPEIGDGPFAPKTTRLEDQLAQLPYVKSFSQTTIVPGNFYNFTTNGITRQNPRPGDEKKSYSMGIIDDRFLKTYEIGLAAGRNFTIREAETGWEKSGKLMINETAARQLGFASAEQAVGKIINWGQPYELVGIVKDYHHQGLQKAIDPVIFMPRRSTSDLTIQLTTDNIQAKLAELERLYKASYPGNPFEFYFVDANYNKQYQSEQQYGQVFTVASALAIFIACLGLFGLAMFTTEQRTKEIGVRKVLGASVASIVTLLSKDFLKLVLIAIVIASPVAWWAMNRWLQHFEYKVDMAWWMFLLAGMLAIGIALLTVSLQSVKAALMNPVKSLKTE
ncbi:ABC transporter permease [Spirosoma utsteinense]|uniref:ABC transport system permease protein n=1 Tax=Spirosoma utsteinense TaxID=2585773 RepID=A0ABR6WF63_9BACT|nr:ABC transporter permease [Spirosoma utsteinense]MBC3789238.1 putative ABC transport system permease protein [Spirosoma utsteinense]MBC3795171.1 putative ABC transport system permease protein [Spirosoma utsteinense]